MAKTGNEVASTHTVRAVDGGLAIERRFTNPGVHPFDEIEWETRDSLIGDPAKPAFEQRDVEFPKSWSQNATNIVAQKYFRGQLGSPKREHSVKQMVGRVSGTIAAWGRQGNYFASDVDAEAFEAELSHILVNQMAAFNSPVWFNVGFEESPTCSACFILSVEDTMESILDWNTKEGMIFRGGSGSGINLSKIRSSREQLSKGGFASGPVSFMRGADSWAGTIKSGGKTRRAAKMVVLDVDHPDIKDFIWCKAKEEKKAGALAAAGFDMSIDGEGFYSIQYQNANNSVRVTQAFLDAVDRGEQWQTTTRVTGEPIDTYDARELMSEIAEAAWQCADPGVQYDTTINDWHTCPNTGRINASNPCFPADAQVHTTIGLIPIGDLYDLAEAGVEFRVYTHHATAGKGGSGVAASVPLAVMRNGVRPIVRLRFSNGQDVRTTPNHRFWTINRGYVSAEDLTGDDQVMLNDMPTPAEDAAWALPAAVEAKAKSFSRGSSVTYQELPDAWSEGLGELTGHLLGDGCMTEDSTVWVYGGDDIDDGMAESHAGLLDELIGGISRQEMQNGTVQLRAGSEAVREFFSNLAVTTKKAPEKRVPWAAFGAPTEVQAAFLRGLFGADGCVSRTSGNHGYHYVGLGSRSELLLKDVQRLLTAFGVRSRIYDVTGSAGRSNFAYIRKDGTAVTYESAQGFDLRVTGSDVERFAAAIGFSAPRKESQLEAMLRETSRYSTKPYATLIGRDEDGQEHVYNLTEPVNHSYMVNGFLVANCSEYMHVDDSACNLSSINLLKFLREDCTFDTAGFEHTVDVMFLAQEIVVGFSSYPTEEIAANARAMRQLGLGYANLGALLMARGLPYDSHEGRSVAAGITALMTGRAYRTSGEVAAAMGPYDEFEKNREPHLRVMRKHRDATYEIDENVESALLAAARRSWEEAVELGELHGHRNAQASVLAPTGTISFLMDCDTTGVEPDFSLVKIKELVGGGHMTIVNRTVPRALSRLGYTEPQIAQIEAYVNDHRTIVGAPEIRDEHLPVFDVAVGERAISHMGHIQMMAAVQPFISGAISKTVNMPAESTVADIKDAYLEAGRLGVKALAIYRDGSKTAQALRTDAKDAKDADAAAELPLPQRKRLPRERDSLTHKFSVAGHEGYITAGRYEDGELGEIFLTDIGKDGSTLRGMMNAFATAISIGLQYGVPLETFVKKFSYMRFDPEGMTTNPEIPFAKSLPDYIMRWLASRFLDPSVHEELGIMSEVVRAKKMAEEAAPEAGSGGNGGNGHSNGHPNGEAKEAESKPPTAALTDTPPVLPAKMVGLDLGPACSQCGGMMQRTGSCYTCSSCGNNTGCG